MTHLPQCVAILGPGLLGGSIALALRQRAPHVAVHLWARRDAAVEDLKQRQLGVLASTSLEEVCLGAELIILCTPVGAMGSLAHSLAQMPLKAGCVVTDVGSVKNGVTAAVETALAKGHATFVGSHPMAGSERAGIEAARAELFEGSTCIVTPTLFTDERALQLMRDFWKLLGCRLQEMPPDEHDRKIARISHLPHLAAAAVTRAALHAEPDAAACVGNGFRDSTRIAAGDPDLWTGIVMENRVEILAALRDARDAMSDLVAMLENLDDKALRRFLADAKVLRDQVPDKA